VYVAARQFGGNVNDSNVGLVLQALIGQVPFTKACAYTVAQYNDPLE